MARKTASVRRESILAELGVDSIEPVILGALIGGEPLLLIGPHPNS